MYRAFVAAVLTVTVGFVPTVALAQRPARPSTAPAAAPQPAAAPTPASADIKLDETTTLKAAALEARMSALLANFALLQRQAQDIQQELAKMLDERKKLIEDAAKKSSVDVKDANEWAFDNKGQRYVHARRGAAPQR